MRKVLFIFITLLVLVSACTERKRETSSLLQLAEEMMRTAPDTALYLLQSLKECDAVSSEDSIYGELLLLEAQVKNGMKLADTVVPCSLSSYYLSRQDTLMHARSLRLSAVTYRDLGRYDEAVAHYNAVIALAKTVDGKRLLGDVYHELAHVHYSQRLYEDPDHSRVMADSIFHLTELMAMELKDTSLWINTLISRSLIPRYYQRYTGEKDLLLEALDLAVSSNKQGYEATISMFLSIVYANLGEEEESLVFAKRNLTLRKGKIPEFVYYLTLGNAYERIGIKDSADYYLAKGKELKEKTEPVYPNSSDLFKQGIESRTTPLEQRMEQMRINDSYRQQSIEIRNIYIVFILVLVLTVGFVIFQIRKKHFREEIHSKELQQKNQELSLMQRKMALLATDVSSVFDKINRITEDCQSKEGSRLRLEESDWRLLQLEMDKRWNHAISILQQEYHLTPNETRLLCLNLLEVPTSYIPYFFERTVGTVYNWNRKLCSKLGIIRNERRTFKEDFKHFIRNKADIR